MAGEQRADQAGHRLLPHTADLRVEAWAPTREGCVVEAVAGMVAGFADVSGATPAGTIEFRVPAAGSAAVGDADLLAEVLDEVIYRMDTASQLPVSTTITPERTGLLVRMEVTDLGQVEPIGAAPKAVSLHGLELTGGPGGWSGRVTLDV